MIFKILTVFLFTILFSVWVFASTDVWTQAVISFWERMQFLWILVPAALWDSINPCAFAVMFILLWAIMKEHKSRAMVLWAGFLFILAIFLSYVAMWIGLYHALATATNTFYLQLAVWIIGVLIWLANLKDYFWYWKWFKMEVPDSWRPKMKKIIKGVVSPLGAFVIWIIISLFLLPCTSGPYIIVLWYLAAESASINMWGYIYILLYNLIFIIPMVIITILIWFGYKNMWELKELKELNVERVHLITWVIMLLIGLYILYDILI